MWLLKEARENRCVSIVCIGAGAALTAAFAVLLGLTNHQLTNLIDWLETRSTVSNINYEMETETEVTFQDYPIRHEVSQQEHRMELNSKRPASFARPLPTNFSLQEAYQFNISKFVGSYQHRPVDNKWHEVEISFRTNYNLYWKNKADRGWLISFDGKKLQKISDAHYKAQVNLMICIKSNINSFSATQLRRNGRCSHCCYFSRRILLSSRIE